ncbi:Actin-related protein 10 [Bagarius yarrelli]|uniref:Actin-related protein 10 n=1 Tax=Bagarius yarrelli TaxID=175774 RepID=A0A556TSP8_BAGYA|nr:Actin-related protein 10 [Bagarius yarrelli]
MPLFEVLGSGGEKTAVVIDLGTAYTKCGFAGETGPRFIIPSELQRPGLQQSIKVVQYNINTEELYTNLKEFIHTLYFRHLLVNPRDRRVVIIESILCPSHFRETLSRVFFKHFEVPSVLFAPSHLMSIMTLGINSALVMDCGYTETLVLPRPAPPPDVDYPLDGRKILHVKGLIRDSVAEILFEQDNDEKSIASLVLDTLVKCPIDTRKVLSENLMVIGGTAMLPGFLHRLLSEIRLMAEKPKYRDALATKSFRIHSPPAKPNCTAWLGGAIFGALQDILGSRSVSRDYYNQTGRIPDWCNLSSPPLESLYDVGKTGPPLMKRAFSTEK